jgi:FHA domain
MRTGKSAEQRLPL